ncbi:UNVERIFIED_CONTAM: Retrovirus-related Pol polyprotein from type-2 retrotransposable element R2DM [Sesamum radiatum]|uniref:Retrovirus-related Pol polyprotein from type-2 retrotransposable element R2DM n=1 Tax=Sesamum radiatum TaxID=300843 RepID=A0AAW2JJG6_SESRA
MLPQWMFYVDYGGPGNRVWLAWDPSFVDVNVVETGAQFMHCSVFIRSLHSSVFITVVYGVNDVIGRRELWMDITRISAEVTDSPWLVGEISTRCWILVKFVACQGISGGQRTSFGAACRIPGLYTCLCTESDLLGIIVVGMPGAWKRLDRLLVNDRWLESWPDTTYVSLSARTSDHSPWYYEEMIATELLRQRKGDLSTNVALAKGFLESAQSMLTADRHCPTLLHLEFCCKLVYRLASRLEQKMLHQRAKMAWMKEGDQCSRVFFRKVAKRRASKRVFQINTDGRTLTDQPEVIEEAEALTAPVSSTEIRQAIFDIDETKAPGPDGYSAGFFKAAWSVIGEEVTQALLDFFRTGRLLKQINATLISLIPKVNSPSVVAEFRPISCCNVLYKAVTKILVQRMRSILHTLISPSQNAFVPGRSIGDNVLLAQELFSGYNQRNLPPRCALKVDLRKAYDTVEWDFLKAALTLFGFPERFIQWIVECVTTTSYSVCINGAPHGFFRGARGLRQGDPMSPFLFVLVMEVLTLMLRQRIEQNGGFSYHWRCEAVQLFQLSFADDLLLFSKAEPNSIQLFKDGLIDFAELSGLQANLQKSHLILSRSAAAYRDSLLAILDFQEGHLPLRYLGLPLLASRLTISDCQPILRKMEARIKGVMLSFAGRVQLIKSVLSALQVYWAMAFILPKHIIKEIEKRLRNFLWKGNLDTGYAKVSWQQVCRPVNEGGLGIRDIHSLNKGLMSRHLWRIISHDSNSIWVSWILHYRLQESSVWTIRTRTGTWGWRKLIRLRDALRPHVHYQIGDGTSFSLWHDPWHPRGPLLPQFSFGGPRHTALPPTAPLSAVISEDTWSWPHITDMESIDITHDLPAIHGGRDRIQWTGPRGSFSSAAAYDLFRPPGPTVGWSSLLVGTFHIPRHRFILWLALQGRLSTTDKPWLQHLGSVCVLCQDGVPESHEHLFFMCPFASECIRAIRREVFFHWPYYNWSSVIRWASARWRGKHVVNAAYRALFASLVYHLWQERNSRIFQHSSRPTEEIVRMVVSETRDLIICKQLPRTVSTRGLYRLWRIPWPVEGIAHT